MPNGTWSRRRLLALCGSSLAVGAGGGHVAAAGVERDDCDPAPHAVDPTEWSYPNYDGANTGVAPARSASTGPLEATWHAATDETVVGDR